jgi:hypothetical protein
LLGALTLAGLAARFALLEIGPEVDPDAYAHAMAGRRVLAGDGGVEMHWVWLPLWHWLHALALRYGHGLDTMRALNAALSAAAPVLLVALLLRSSDDQRKTQIAWLAGGLLALSPALLVHGASSQLEPPVLTLTLAACLAWERARERPIASLAGGAALAAAALIRYEAWAATFGLAIAWLRERRPWHRAVILFAPAAAVLGWCIRHRWATGEWFQFLRYNADFAHGYLGGVGYPWGGEPNAALALVWYLTAVPWLEHAVLAPLMLLGAAWFVRSAPRSLLSAQLSMLVLLAIGFAAGQHLGLPRHGLVLGPLYATTIARGILRARDWLAETKLRRAAPLASAIAIGLVFTTRTVPGYWRGVERHATAYREDLAAARALRRACRDDEPIFCDHARIEVLSNLPPQRFTRWPLRDVDAFQLKSAAGECGRVLIVSDESSTDHLAAWTSPVYRSGAVVLLAYAPKCPRAH